MYFRMVACSCYKDALRYNHTLVLRFIAPSVCISNSLELLSYLCRRRLSQLKIMGKNGSTASHKAN